MLTVDFDRLGVDRGHRVLDVGCGAGRHAVEAARRGATVIALDRCAGDLADAAASLDQVASPGDEPVSGGVVRADAARLPFADATFDRVIAAEILEHLPDDSGPIAELVRVLRPGGMVAVTVPRYAPELVCWALSRAYHEVPGGHVRIYRRRQLLQRLSAGGLVAAGIRHHYAHALHVPYWWLRCLVGIDRDHPLAAAYHRLLVWDLMRRPLVTRALERALDPVLGKSLVVYLRKPATRPVPAAGGHAHAA